MNRFIIWLVIWAGTGSLYHPAISQPVVKNNWQAQWIGEQYPSAPNSFLRFRYRFHLPEKPATLTAHIAVDSKYWLYINGQLVVFEGQLKRGPTPKDTYFDEVELAPHLRQGDNVIAVLVWYWGRDGFCHKNSGRAGLLFEAGAGSSMIYSNASWKIAPDPAFIGQSAPPWPNYRLPEFNIRYDARIADGDWINPTYDDSRWTQAAELGRGGTAPWNRLWKRPIPLWYDSGILPYENLMQSKDSLTGHTIVKGILPRNLSITPWFEVNAPAGLRIDMRTDNYKGGSEYNVRSEYITRNGRQAFETPAYMNGHEVWYSLPPGVELLRAGYRETRYNAHVEGSFQSNDSFLDTLWKKSLYTMNVNMRDAIQDPDRERAQWWGDVVIILGQIFYSLDYPSGTAALKKAMSNLVEWQKPDGVLFSPIPAGNWDRELPGQMLASIGSYGFGRYFDYTADSSMMRYLYPAVRKYLDLWHTDARGLVVHRAGGWDWHDWGSRIDAPLLDNAWYVMALRTAIRMAKMSFDDAQAEQWQQKLVHAEAAFQEAFWKGNVFRSDSYESGGDDRGNGLAVVAGLAKPDQWPHIKRLFDTTFLAGPYLEKYILEAYFLMGDGEGGVARMKKRYQDMVQHPATTLWEGWEVGSGTYGGGSYNHGWSGGPLTLMQEYVAGIKPATPGYGKVAIYPQLSGLQNFRTQAPLPDGNLELAVSRKSRSVTMTLICDGRPVALGIPVVAPGGQYKSIRINGKRIKPNSSKLQPVKRFNQQVYYKYEEANARTITIQADW